MVKCSLTVSIGIWAIAINAEKHGVSLGEIESLFAGAPLIGPDREHSIDEQRFRAAGPIQEGRNLFAIFTWRIKAGRKLLRFLSARYMHDREVRAYEKKISGF